MISFYKAVSPFLKKDAHMVIFNYHQVLAARDFYVPDAVTSAQFQQQLSWITDLMPIVDLERGLDQMYSGTLGQTSAAITFDDGYKNNVELAAPILQRLGVNGTFFIVTDALTGSPMWSDSLVWAIKNTDAKRVRAKALGKDFVLQNDEQKMNVLNEITRFCKYLPPTKRDEEVAQIVMQLGGGEPPSDLMMNADDIRCLASMGMNVGVHAKTHNILTTIADQEVRDDVANAKQTLESIVGQAVNLYAYPNGKANKDFQERHERITQEIGFKAALSTDWGVATRASRRYALPRILPWRTSRFGFELNILQARMMR